MKRQGLLSTTGLLLLGLIAAMTLHEWEDVVPGSQETPQQKRAPTLVASGIQARSFDDNGELRYQLSAQHLTRSADGERTNLTQPDLTVKGNDRVWTIDADQGEVAGSGNEITFSGNVHAHGDGQQPLSLDTSTLHYYPDRKTVSAPDSVVITHPSGTTRAGSLEADLAAGTLQLRGQVETRYEAPAS